MSSLYGSMITFISFVLVFGVIVFVHELGHFMFAKWNNIKVDEFAMGMGKRLWAVTRGETTYAINLLPIGGYVKLDGEDINSNDPRSLSNASPFAQFQVLIAGASMNFILGFLVFWALFIFVGEPVNVIGELIPDKPAIQSGIQVGDKILSIDGVETPTWELVTKSLVNSDDSLDIKILRKPNDGTALGEIEKIITVVPIVDKASGKRVIGIVPAKQTNVGSSFKNAGAQTWNMSTMILTELKKMFTTGINKEQVMGPVGMASVIGDAAKKNVLELLFLTGLLSINLGVFNLLPFPALDGGRLVFVIFEMITGKRPKKEHEGWFHGIGMIILLSFMALVVFWDVLKITGK